MSARPSAYAPSRPLLLTARVLSALFITAVAIIYVPVRDG